MQSDATEHNNIAITHNKNLRLQFQLPPNVTRSLNY